VELEGATGQGIETLRAELSAARDASIDRARPDTGYNRTRMLAITAARRFLFERRRQGRIFDDTYHRLEDELDRAELQAAKLDSTLLEG
jgi:CPA1 family monovalent cation:H+ antiporter